MIAEIRRKLSLGEYEFSGPAVDRMNLREITVAEVNEAISSGEIVEDYPDDQYGPSCLAAGFAVSGRLIHVHCTYPTRPVLKVITCFEPDPKDWIDLRKRRPSEDSQT